MKKIGNDGKRFDITSGQHQRNHIGMPTKLPTGKLGLPPVRMFSDRTIAGQALAVGLKGSKRTKRPW